MPASGGSLRGYTLLVQPQSNTITELGPDGKPRWTLTGLQGPSDAQVLANQHVLVAEQGRVTERDLSGNVLWKVEGIQPLSVQRLANGNTFIPCERSAHRGGPRGQGRFAGAGAGGIVAARRLPDRRIVAFDRQSIIQLDQAGRQIKQVPVMAAVAGPVAMRCWTTVTCWSLSPGIGNITEFDMEGKEVGSFDLPGASHGFRLPNGHTLVTVQGTKYIELDKNWKPIKGDRAGDTRLPRQTKVSGILECGALGAALVVRIPNKIRKRRRSLNCSPSASNEHPMLPTLSQEATTMSNRSFLLSLAAALLASSFARDGRGADPADPDQARLDAALLPTNNAGLVNFFHCGSEANQRRARWIN